MAKKNIIQGDSSITTLNREYELRFSNLQKYRNDVWEILTKSFFQQYIEDSDTVLDLGCGWGEFINNISCKNKIGMDLNEGAKKYLNNDVTFLNQDCSKKWSIKDNSLDIVFTSNFFEHLLTKQLLSSVIENIFHALKPGGKIICMGPNIKFTKELYWDFYDHYIPLTELSIAEALEIQGFNISYALPKFLPYTMVNRRPPSLFFVKSYLKLKFSWVIFGKQFLVIARK